MAPVGVHTSWNKHSSIIGYLSAIRRMQIVKGLGDLFAASWPLLEYTLYGIKLRLAKRRDTHAKQRLPITPDILRKLKSSRYCADFIMLWAASCTCFFGFLRSGEVTVPLMKEYDPEGHLSGVSGEPEQAFGGSSAHKSISVYIYLGKTGNDLCSRVTVVCLCVCLCVCYRSSCSSVQLSRVNLVQPDSKSYLEGF